MQTVVDATWFTGEHGQQLKAGQPQPGRSRKLTPATQQAVDDINERYQHDLNDDIPEL